MGVLQVIERIRELTLGQIKKQKSSIYVTNADAVCYFFLEEIIQMEDLFVCLITFLIFSVIYMQFFGLQLQLFSKSLCS